MAIYNAYLEGAEREAAIFNMEINNQYEKLSMLFEMAHMELEQVKKDIELKVFRESGTYDDLEYLISEAEAQAAQDQQNILSQILQWFANVIQKMVTSIKNFFAGSKDIPDDAEAEVALPENESGLFKAMDGILNSISTMDGKITVDGVIKIVGSALGLGGLVAGGAAVMNKINQDYPIKSRIMKWAAVKAVNNACNKTVGQLNNIVTNVINKIQDSTVGKFICDEFLKPVQEKCQSLIDICTNAIGAFKGKVGDAANAVKNAVTGNNQNAQAQAGQPQQANTANGPATVTSANTQGNGAGARIVVKFTDNSSGTPVNRVAYLSKDGKVSGAGDSKPIQATAKAAIEGDAKVKAAVQRITKATEKNAMKNSPQAQMATGNNVDKNAQVNKVKAAEAKGMQSPQAQLVNASAADLQIELGDDYTVEMVDDILTITINEEVEIPEDYLTTTQSIFGMIAEEEAAEDPELAELQKLFEEL